MRTAGKQARNFLACEQLGLLLWQLGHGRAQVRDVAGAPQHGLEQEATGARRVVDAAVGEFAVFDEVQQIRLDLGRAQLLGAAMVMTRQSGDRIDVALLGSLSQTAHGHGVEHALT